LVVATKFKQCADSSNAINNCHCAVYIRLSEEKTEFAYLDFCSEPFEVKSIDQVKIQHYEKKATVLNCSEVLSSENEEKEWSEITAFGNFKCAQFDSSSLIVSNI
jgi:hypothetical protein